MVTEQITLMKNVDSIGCGMGCLTFIDEEVKVPLPLEKVSIESKVVDRISHVILKQSFQNPNPDPIEAVYIFPISGDAAIHHFELKVGEQVIIGEIQERKQARQNYQKALNEGKKASLLEQERDDIFTIQVGNITPGESISVEIHYSEVLSFYENGTTALHLPLVVAPRYIPGSPLEGDSVGNGVEFDTDQVPDASRISPPRLADGFNPAIDFNLEVKLFHAGKSMSDLSCSQHASKTSFNQDWIVISLSKKNELLNRDFILRWSLVEERIQSQLLTFKADEENSYNLLTVIPPEPKGFLGIPRDIIFVVDRSGSMDGTKMISAAQACSHLLNTLNPSDRFAIQAFDHSIEWFEPFSNEENNKFLNADEAGLSKGHKFLRQIDARGGTEIEKAISGAFEIFKEESSSERSPIIVLLTDGQIGNESSVLQRIQKQVDESRIFTVGIDTAVNATFLKKLANLGGGSSAFVVPGEELEGALNSFAREIGQPLMTDLSLKNFESEIEFDSLTPSVLPDLFKGRAITIFFKAKYVQALKVQAQMIGGDSYAEVVTAQVVDSPALAALWARKRIRDLEDSFRVASESTLKTQIKSEMIDLSIKHNILCRFTSFLAIDHSKTIEEVEKLRTIVQPVENPEGWDMVKGALPPPSPAPMMAGGAPQFAAAAPMPMPEPQAMEEICLESSAFTGDSEGYADGFDTGALSPSVLAPGAKSRKRGFMSKVTESFKGKSRAKKKIKAKASSEVSRLAFPAMSKQFAEIIQAFLQAFSQAFQLIEKGQLPEVSGLKRKRLAVLEALKQAENVTELPQIQRFIRTASKELLAALESGFEAETLVPIIELYKSQLTDALEELELVGSHGGQRDFWEAGI